MGQKINPEFLNEIKNATNHAILYPRKNQEGDSILEALGIDEESILGMTLKYTAGISVYHGWIRLFGGESSEFTDSISDWNDINDSEQVFIEDALLVGYDVLGGFFAVNTGAFEDEDGMVYYFAPDTLLWESTELDYNDFFHWCLYGDIEDYYKPYFWKSFAADCEALKANQGFQFDPPVYELEEEDIESLKRNVVSLRDLWELTTEEDEELEEE
ncbi:hypothetical protein LPTSP3_g25360 [Leptospira kobayashii]|uniref:DUF2625 family protein n=1 Tax=Leptospira kobayashii TaxID=1917830 RepID=A0ABM7UL26_9LEPT|nr:DUF2625 family protein [Leptospira kobayashii]BDA79606.1 hypothetical protein LPTSP3_g25360 [Leptospira kobayashii]